MDPIIAFLCSPLGIVLAIIAAALAGRFLWHVVILRWSSPWSRLSWAWSSTRSVASATSWSGPVPSSSTRRRAT